MLKCSRLGLYGTLAKVTGSQGGSLTGGSIRGGLRELVTLGSRHMKVKNPVE